MGLECWKKWWRKMYCSNCGSKMDSDDLFCFNCGNDRKTELDNDKSSSGLSTSRKIGLGAVSSGGAGSEYIKKRKSIPQCLLKSAWFISLVCFAGFLLTAYSTFALDSDVYLSDLGIDEREQNIRVCERIAADYYASHTYTEDDIYDCDNMAQDVWNMLRAKGINAKIAVGKFDTGVPGKAGDGKAIGGKLDAGDPGETEVYGGTPENSYPLDADVIDNFNHAWVLAEVSPGSWLAIECTGGYVVYSEENENYYQGLTFSNPKNYRSFLDLYSDWKTRAREYEDQRLYYNELVEEYNQAGYFEQLALKSGVEVAEKTLKQKEDAFMQTDAELNALLRYG